MSDVRIMVRAFPGTASRVIEARRRAAPGTVRDGLERLGSEGADLMRRRRVHEVTGNFAAGIGYEVEGSGWHQSVSIGSSAPHAHLVEHGRPPGRMPSPARIAGLLGLDRRAGFLVARAIGAHGTPPNPVLRRTRTALAPVLRDVRATILREVGDLDPRGKR